MDPRQVGRAAQGLSETDREMVSLRYFGELDAEDIGQELNLTPKAVRSQLDDSLARLAALCACQPDPVTNSPEETRVAEEAGLPQRLAC